MKKLLFIYNPTSGKGRVADGLATILNTFARTGWLTTVYPTQCKGDAARAAREFGPHFDRVVCAGGDGTLSETVTGLMSLSAPPLLGYIPFGSTNDCAVNLNLPKVPTQAALIAAQDGVPRESDIGKLNGSPFVYVAAFGAFTQVAYGTSQDLKNTFGHLAYVMEGIASLPTITPYHIKVEYDGNVIEGDFLYGMVSNTTSVGGVKNFPPGNPDLSDGLLEVTLISPIRGIKTVEEFGRAVLSGDPSVLSSVLTSFSTPKVTITSEEGLTWTLDGEPGGTHRVAEIEALHNAYTIVHGYG